MLGRRLGARPQPIGGDVADVLADAPLVADGVADPADPAPSVVYEQPRQLAAWPPGAIAEDLDGARFLEGAAINLARWRGGHPSMVTACPTRGQLCGGGN